MPEQSRKVDSPSTGRPSKPYNVTLGERVYFKGGNPKSKDELRSGGQKNMEAAWGEDFNAGTVQTPYCHVQG